MLNVNWNSDWLFSKSEINIFDPTANGGDVETVHLPHDAMILEKRTEDTKNKHQTGFYPGGIYYYNKNFFVPEDWASKTAIVEFEGVYTNARIFVNGDFAGGCKNGYKTFSICLDEFLKYGQENTIKVVVNNSMEQNSRWYSGSGIYRPVHLHLANLTHIELHGVKIDTPEVSKNVATVLVRTKINHQEKLTKKVLLKTTIFDSNAEKVNEIITPVTLFGFTSEIFSQRFVIKNPQLWDVETPHLYHAKIEIVEGTELLDSSTENFGIRSLSLDSEEGLKLNGKPTKLRGACIHHDNGVIGAATFADAEERRVKQLKEAGFNSIRSSHHPISKSMLEACDRYGMLVLDELSDMWTRSKNINDYSNDFLENWESDVEALVEKDYNHPSVIMYITGNEIQEAGTPKGAKLNRDIHSKFKVLDPSRYTTSAINGLIAAMDKMGEIMAHIMGVSLEELAAQQAQAQEANNSGEGSDQANSMQNILRGPLADAFAVDSILSETLEEFTAATDVAGYNYLTARHEIEHDSHPNRVVLGTETFPVDIAKLWRIVEENSHVIGDMTWTGYDYLGEAGIGIFYYDGRMGFMPNWQSSVAYIGDIDITGFRRPISYYREIVFGLRKAPFIAVERLNRKGQTPNQTAWMWKDNIASWTWNGFEGEVTNVDVLSNSPTIELFLNGRSLGQKATGEREEYIATYEVPYEKGELLAVSYDSAGNETGRDYLVTADKASQVSVDISKSILRNNSEDLAYLDISLVDDSGLFNNQDSKIVNVEVTGAGTLQGFGSANPEIISHYQDNSCETFDGKVLAVIRAGQELGNIFVKIQAEGFATKEVEIEVKSIC
ncbi:glycoside hydrolase family 2 protein [Streptococcus moroccensis]|uniref:Beta-galactosidase n=1 Tax=Streptococcus moroccensis TaxID=1451356 RepID=A0ABT9YRV2_9STRE|nr:glycoside hydrolase family 2 TIM barrel-domain containing protein [Streptococcus moroccensis]MDQ0221840.1 beta-galactosidase [Streptococcus moroccensis]